MIAETVEGTAMGHLMRLMQLAGHPQPLEAVCRTSDGMYLAQLAGDVGYNVFLGQPKRIDHALPSTRALALATWNKLDALQRLAVQALCLRPMDGSPIPLRHFLPEEAFA